jgi:hypothetical protein
VSPTVKTVPLLGINKDISANETPIGAITDASNVRFREGAAELFQGQTDAYPTAPIAPVSTFPVRIGTARYWIALSLNKAYCVTGSPATWTNITRQTASIDVDYSASLDTLWNGGILNGVPILNNGTDVPQMWSPVATSQKLQALSAWPANVTARVMRPYRNYMFAFDVTKAGTRYPHRVKWSHPADPGTVPVSWDETDATKDAGEFDLDGAGFVVDALPLRQNLVVYKESSTYLCSIASAPAFFNFQLLFSASGMLSADCAVEIDGSHVVLTSNDVIRHDGISVQSIVDKATRRWLFQNIDSTAYDRCFVTKNVYFNEVWVCFPELGQTRCTKALVYNYKDNAISFRDLPGVTSANTGLVDEGASETFDSAAGTFDSDVAPYNQNEFGAQLTRTMMCAPDRPALVLADSTTQYFGENIPGYVERTGISLDAPNQVKTIKRLRPRIRATAGSIMTFKVGSHMDLYGPVTWSAPVTYRVGQDFTVDAFASGRFLAWRMESSSSYGWRMDGLDLEFTARGGY